MDEYKCEIIYPNQDIDFRISFFIDEGSAWSIPHFHNWIEIVYLLNGTLDFRIENEEYHLTKNQIMVVKPMVMHSTCCIDGNTAILLQIPISFLEKFDINIQNYEFKINYENLTEVQQEQIWKMSLICQKIFISYEQNRPGRIFECYSLAFDLVSRLMNYFTVSAVGGENLRKSEKDRKRIQNIFTYMDNHFSEDLTLAGVAEKFGLSSVYFLRYFKKMSGVTFLEYLQRVRLNRIQKDLLCTDYTIQYILDRNGFHNYKLFLKLFKEVYHCTPKEYRSRK